MSFGTPLQSARPVTFEAADLFVSNGIKTSFATVASPVTVLVADLNGAKHAGLGFINVPLPRTVTIGRSSASGAYTVTPIVITGMYGGAIVTESLTPGSANGNDTLWGAQPFDAITSIAIPAQVSTGGAFVIGTGDICAPRGTHFTAVELVADGRIQGAYDGGLTDATPSLAGVLKPIVPHRIRTNPTLSNPTTVGLTVYVA